MRGRIIRFSYLARRRRSAVGLRPTSQLPRKIWLYRLLDKTAAPFWFARFKRTARHRYRDWALLRFYLTGHGIYRVDVRGADNYTYHPSTIIAGGHKRDMDVPLITATLYLRPGRLKYLRTLYVATRDDLFEKGFFTLYFPFMTKLRPLIAPLNGKTLFDIMQCSPVKLPDEQTVNQLLNETMRIEGNLPLAEALDPEWRTRLLGEEASQPNLTLKDAIYRAPVSLLAQYSTPRMFSEPLATRIRQRHHTTMKEQLYNIIRILEKGGTLFVMPEGQVTPDGRFSKMRAAVTRLILQSRVETRLLPINISYDFMDTARPNVTIILGPEVLGLKHQPKNELAETIRSHVISLSCVTMSGLVSRWLVAAAAKGQAQINLSQMRSEIWNEVTRLRPLEIALDRQLENWAEFEKRFDRFVSYARLKNIFGKVFKAGVVSKETVRLDLVALGREECQSHNDNPVRYSHNELTELLAIWDALPEAEKAQKQAANSVTSFEEGAKRVRERRTAG